LLKRFHPTSFNQLGDNFNPDYAATQTTEYTNKQIKNK